MFYPANLVLSGPGIIAGGGECCELAWSEGGGITSKNKVSREGRGGAGLTTAAWRVNPDYLSCSVV